MLGTGLPGAVGLKIAQPDRTVFGFAGDGSSISTIQALSTAARYDLGAKFVVCNNRSYRILKAQPAPLLDRAGSADKPAISGQLRPGGTGIAFRPACSRPRCGRGED